MSPALLRRHRWLAAVSLVALVGAAACGSDDSESATSSPDVPRTVPDATTPATPPVTNDPSATTIAEGSVPDDTADPSAPGDTADAGGSVPASMQPLVDIAVADLTERLELDDPTLVTVTSIEEVTWRTGALGCPRKDMQYTQVLTPGYRIVLTADGVNYQYHGGEGRDPFYCATPETPAG